VTGEIPWLELLFAALTEFAVLPGEAWWGRASMVARTAAGAPRFLWLSVPLIRWAKPGPAS